MLCLFVFVFFQAAFTQFCPPNLDFETGTFDNWQCATGITTVINGKNEIKLTPSLPIAKRHEIISTSGAKDMYGNFPQLCPYGGKYSIKLGNESTGSEAEGISYTFQVPANVDTFSFTYFYAVVFEDPMHSAEEQPRFFVTAYDVATGNLINCASYDYISTGGIPGFKVSPIRSTVLYKEWSPVSIQFAGLANRTVRLEFKTADCTRGGHFGYAYVDVGSSCSNILATAPYCIETNAVILNAPYGFQTYTWYNEDYSAVIGNQQSLTLSPPPATSGVFHVDIVPYPGYGCRDTAQAIVTPLPVPDTPVAKSDYYFCQFQSATPLEATPQPGSDILWYDKPVGGLPKSVAPIPSTSVPGVYEYYVAQKVLFGCESPRKKIRVTINPTPSASFTVNNIEQCDKGNNFKFTSTSANTNQSTYSWSFGDGKTISSPDSLAAYNYSKTGTYTVKLKVENPPGCATEKTATVIVYPNPVALFGYPALICEKDTAVRLQDQSTLNGNGSQINAWHWEIEGKISSLKNPNPFVVNSAGSLPVKLTVATNKGCVSDTFVNNLTVRYRPTAALDYSKLLCENEVIQLLDQSLLPAAATAESINKWYWQIDGGNINTTQNPSLFLKAGTHQIKLVAESNYGCKSLETDSLLLIHAKPDVQLSISDSCARRPITYTGVDTLSTVTKWYWNFGAGYKNGNSQITQVYANEGYRPLSLVGQTIFGCKDTVVRAFTIYDTKANAGKDTIAAMNEPVQLDAHGEPKEKFTWNPKIGLNNPNIEKPVAVLDQDQLYKLDAVSAEGCESHTQILIKRYKGPDIYIPTAFTPNGDGKNDVLKVFPVGIKAFGFFAVYDRWGELLYKTTDYYAGGWDGMYKGKKMGSGVYIVVAQATDYKGVRMEKKLTVTLIR